MWVQRVSLTQDPVSNEWIIRVTFSAPSTFDLNRTIPRSRSSHKEQPRAEMFRVQNTLNFRLCRVVCYGEQLTK
jgi:hypothetical protein